MRSEICGTGRERKLLGNLLLQARGIRGVREVAAEIGISATSLNRAEKGRAQDIGTTDKLIVWLKSKPARADQLQIAFRNKTRINPRIALALAHLAIAARNQLAASEDLEAA